MTLDSHEYRFASLERRIKEIEEVKPEVLAEQVRQLQGQVSTLLKVAITILIGIVGTAVATIFNLVSGG